ncbi:hypothetical protein [Clostridium ljungdahlii]|uniref:hypothetical protein n=1 Tax=Clostridium ljungdahlii TaxID=1538 RepID=UPI00386E81D1
MSKRNNADDLMQLALYMVPKYMKRIQKYNKMFANSDNEKSTMSRNMLTIKKYLISYRKIL